jgi:glycosyltransferase involved in cell wall biosynthesis
MMPALSVVVPVFDEQPCLNELYERLTLVLAEIEMSWELVFVDDGSSDGSYRTMLELRQADERVKIIKLSRNFGKESAMTAGLTFASGDAVVIMDSDLQHPPEIIPEFVRRWHDGYDIVYGVQHDRGEQSRMKSLTAGLFYRVRRRLSDTKMPAETNDFRLVSKQAVDAYRRFRERNRYVRGMFDWIGFRQVGVPYTPPARVAGQTKFKFSHLARLATVGILSFSTAPLRFVLKLGFIVSLLAVLEGTYAIVGRASGAYGVPGWASIVTVVSFLGGFQLIVLGVIGQYVGLVYEEVKARPVFLTEAIHGIEAPLGAARGDASEDDFLAALQRIVIDR